MSGGIFSGHLAADIPEMTFAAINAATDSLTEIDQEAPRTASYELCIYVPEQVEFFRRALLSALRAMAVQPRQPPQTQR
eukprot:5130043-Alexandrium_andersonii.AAC.1